MDELIPLTNTSESSTNTTSSVSNDIGKLSIENDQQPVSLYQVGGRALRKTCQRDKQFVAEVNSSKRQTREKRLTKRRRRQKSDILGTRTHKRQSAKGNVWTGEGRFGQPDGKRPAPEDEFLEDMLSDNPRFQSTSQTRPMEYWENAAAEIPEYRGPWQPMPESESSALDFEFYR